MAEKSAMILGATGLVGSNLLRVLLNSQRYSNITAISRRSLPISDTKLQQILIADFETLGDQQYEHAYQVDDIFCCLGTTIKKAGSRENFWQVDYKYPMLVARQAKKFGVKQFLIVSAIGANLKSPFFYNRVKGSLEQALAAIGFPALHIFQPSLLLGKRQEFRLGEALGVYTGRIFGPFLNGGLKKYRPVLASLVACAMYRAACSEREGLNIYNSAQIADMGQEC